MRDSLMRCSCGFGVLRGDPLGGPRLQLLLIDLIGSCEWELLEEEHPARVLVCGSVRERELLELVFRGASAGTQHDERVRHLAFHLVIEWHHESLMNRRM